MASNWIDIDTQLGWPAPGIVWQSEGTSITGTAVGVGGIPTPPIGTVARYRDVGSTSLGAGEFIWLVGVDSTVLGSAVTFDLSTGTIQGQTVLWAGTANTGRPLAFATAATVGGTAGWYQIGGTAIVATSGTVADGNPLYYATTGVIGASGVNGKQVLACCASSANGVPATNQSLATMDRPFVQGQTS